MNHTPGCLVLATLFTFAGIVAIKQGRQPPAQRIIQKAAEDSLRLSAFESCKSALPQLSLEPKELVYRAPGRYQVIRRRTKDQIACITWQGEVQYVDTAIIQPGNGDLR